MSRKTILALAAAAALAIAALAPTSASAFGHGGGGHVGGGGHFGGSHFGGGHTVSRGPVGHHTTFSRIGHGPRGPHHFARFDHDRGHHFCHFNHCGPRIGWWWRHHHHPYWVYPVGGETVVEGEAAPAQAYTAPVASNNCNCLTKSYLPDGSVMFKDVCTKEAAVATPDELKAQAAGIPPAAETK